ncbi:MAG TPA: hypothetical protein VGM88_15515 [Kofleriaceae bacterium]|jgi:hypothetical protein
MAVRYDVTGDRLSITQQRRGLRIAMWIWALGGALGLVLMLVPMGTTNHLVCAQGGACTIAYGHHDPIALPGGTVRLESGQLWLDHADGTKHHLCSGTDAELDAVRRGFAAPPYDATCSSNIGGISPFAKIAGLLGILIVLGMMGSFLVETEVVVDRTAKTVSMRGFRWPRKRWAFERPIADVKSVVVQRVSVGRGQRRHVVSLRFDDDRVVCAWAPMAYRVDELDRRIATLRELVKHA